MQPVVQGSYSIWERAPRKGGVRAKVRTFRLTAASCQLSTSSVQNVLRSTRPLPWSVADPGALPGL
jgi:hypothetical protein